MGSVPHPARRVATSRPAGTRPEQKMAGLFNSVESSEGKTLTDSAGVPAGCPSRKAHAGRLLAANALARGLQFTGQIPVAIAGHEDVVLDPDAAAGPQFGNGPPVDPTPVPPAPEAVQQ